MIRHSLSLIPPLLVPLATASAQDGSPTRNVNAFSSTVTTPVIAQSTSGTVELLLTNIVGLPESQVPGLPGVFFDPGTGTTDFDRVYGSPGGNWIITAFADLPSDEAELVLVNGTVVQREGQPGPWTGGTENAGSFDRRCDVNDSGDFTFATNTDGAANDDYIVTNVGGAWGFAAREGDAIGPLPGNTYDDLIDSPIMLASGAVGFSADGIDGAVPSTQDDILVLDGTLLLQEGVSIPAGQAAGAMEFMENFDLSDFFATEDGANWLIQGDLTGDSASDDVVILNGNVVLQEGTIVPGSTFTDPIDFAGIFAVYLDEGGNWFARGDNDVSSVDWIVRNGTLLKTLGDPIFAGATEVFDDTTFAPGFFMHIGNSFGDYIIGGVTNSVNLDANAVLVKNDERVICREGDPVDLDGNGMLDDDAFIGTFGDDDGHLDDDGMLYLVVQIEDANGDVRGQAVLRMDTGTPSIGTNYCTAVPNSTGTTGVIAAIGSAMASDNDVTLIATDLPINAFGFFLASQVQGFVTNPGGSAGNLCLAGSIGRYVGPGQIQTTGLEGEFSLVIDLTNVPQPTGPVSVMAGENWNFQAWHRDSVGGSATSNFTDATSVDFL
ncbi:MAG: hypothetical protein AAF726_04290 [Planctomycetota bacterium]